MYKYMNLHKLLHPVCWEEMRYYLYSHYYPIKWSGEVDELLNFVFTILVIIMVVIIGVYIVWENIEW